MQRAGVRETMHAVDYDAIQSRLCRALHRREYHVESPNALWHIDSYHKLIRWRIVVHGGIDGYSRVVPYSKQHLIIDLIQLIMHLLRVRRGMGCPLVYGVTMEGRM